MYLLSAHNRFMELGISKQPSSEVGGKPRASPVESAVLDAAPAGWPKRWMGSALGYGSQRE